MISDTVVELSSWQYTLSSLSQFVFIPLTLGLSLLLVLMESTYLLNGTTFHKTACQFWGRIFAVNFTLGIAARMVLLYQFGMNFSYLSHYIGDVFALPLVVDALSSMFIASLLYGPYLFGWERLNKLQHLLTTWLLFITVNLSAFWTLVTFGWMRNPVGAAFNAQSLRIELTDFRELFNFPTAEMLITATAACYATAAATVLAVSAWLLLRTPEDRAAQSCFKLAASMGLVASLITGVGYATNQGFIASDFKLSRHDTSDYFSVENENEDERTRIRNGMKAYNLLQDLRDENKNPKLLSDFNRLKIDLGRALLLKRWTDHIAEAEDSMITLAALSLRPSHPILTVWLNRFNTFCAYLTLLLFGRAILDANNPNYRKLKLYIYTLPLPWFVSVGGWIIAETDKLPWSVTGILPAFLSLSSLSVKDSVFNLSAYMLVDVMLLGIACYLIRQIVTGYSPANTTPDSAHES